MKDQLNLDLNTKSKIVCSDCKNIPLLGIEILNQCDKLSDIIKVHSYCIYNHNKNKHNEFLLNDIILNKENNQNIEKFELKCEFCKTYQIDDFCLSCKRNVCKRCSNYHKSHNLYESNKYLLNENDLKRINDNFIESKNILKENYSLIQKQIDNYKLEIKKLENILKEYNEINDIIIKYINFIIEEYKYELISKNPIYYPLYFNITNNLIFNQQKLEMPENEMSIQLYSNILFEKIKTGSYFLLLNSKYSKDINDYTNKNIINYNSLSINNFEQIRTSYSSICFFEKNKILGLIEKKSKLEIYNYKTKIVEMSIKLNMDYHYKYHYYLYYKDNIIFIMNENEIMILNSKLFSVLKHVKLKNEIEKIYKENIKDFLDNNGHNPEEYHQFTHGIILSNDSIGIIYEGNLKYLDDVNNLKDLIVFDGEELINIHYYPCFNIYQTSEYFIYFLLYSRNRDNNTFILEKIIVLLRKHICVDEVSYTPSKDFYLEERHPFCTFDFNSLTHIDETQFIISFESRIVMPRDQDYYYITDDEYDNEYIYYYFDLKENKINQSIFSTKNDSFILYSEPKENKFYLLYKGYQDCFMSIKKLLEEINKKTEFIKIEMDKLYFKEFYIQNRTIIGWKNNSIKIGKIDNNNKLNIVQKSKIRNILFVNLNPNIIFT